MTKVTITVTLVKPKASIRGIKAPVGITIEAHESEERVNVAITITGRVNPKELHSYIASITRMGRGFRVTAIFTDVNPAILRALGVDGNSPIIIKFKENELPDPVTLGLIVNEAYN